MLAEFAGNTDGGIVASVIALIALTAMEIVLGIDNIVFISVVTGRLPPKEQPLARTIGLAAAMGTRVLLLMTISWIIQLKQPIFSFSQLGIDFDWLVGDKHIDEVTWKDLIMLGGGLFLIRSSVREIHAKVTGAEEHHHTPEAAKFANVIFQIAVLDIIFSLDSVITAVGMAKDLWVMITAVVLAVGVMMLFSGAVARFVEEQPTVKVLALSFLLLIGVMLVAEGCGKEIPKGYIYFAMGFALAVEMLNLRTRKLERAKEAKDAEHPFVD